MQYHYQGFSSMEFISLSSRMIDLFALLPWRSYLDQGNRILLGKTECLSARMEDIEGEASSACAQRGTKRKQDFDFIHWRDEGQELVRKAQCLSTQVDGCRCFFTRAKLRWDVDRLVDALEVHGRTGDVLLRHALSDAQGPCRGYHIPVKALVGGVASNTLRQLQLLLLDDKVGRIAIYGVEGIGKTFLMKHLHNSVLKWVDRFDHLFWVTFLNQFTIKHLQDVVAAAVNCDLSSDVNLSVRARKLSDTLAGLGSFALFLDGVPGDYFSLEQVGIPVAAEGSKSKLVLTTSFTLIRRFLDCSEAVKVDPLSEDEAYELFMHEARIDMASASSLGDTPRLLADRCCRVPRMIVNIATHMCGINDPHEWRHALFESRRLGKE